ncbi:MAG: hypothetical protein V4685_09460 [Bacteroidota bacterium]
MKTILLSSCIMAYSLCAVAQVDTTPIGRDTIRSAWSQRPDTAFGKQQRPISSQPLSNSPVPPPLTNPIDNPTSGQTNPPEQAQPIEVPPPLQKPDTLPKRKPIKPVSPKPKKSDYDTVPGTNRKG